MPGLGRTARDPNTEYVVYEFLFNGRVFYVGLAHGHIRHTRRWGYVANLVRHERAGTLKPAKAKSLVTPSNYVIAAMVRADLPEHEVRVSWRGKGRAQAQLVETARICELAEGGVVLANVQENPIPAPCEVVLRYLGIPPTMQSP